jgi:7-cyano-7-deazaguanine synthase in queuosine biosynthesis
MKEERDKLFSFYRDSNFLRYKQFHLERDILRIAFSLFECEKQLKKTGSVNSVSIMLSQETLARIDTGALKEILEELFLLILLEDIAVDIREIDDSRGRQRRRAEFPEKEAIILFSAGVDSYSGIKIAERKYQDLLGVFVAHNDQTWIIRIVEQIKPLIDSQIRTLYAPGMSALGYSQLRGFVYILSAGVYANLCKADEILVTECGPTMYQPLFSPYDSITYTTHPYVLKAAKGVLDIMLEDKRKIIIPFEDLTKAEVVSNSGIGDFSVTHSCISQGFGDHDGTCFGCVIKRLACAVSDVTDVEYRKDMFEKDANQDNLLNALTFSADLLNGYDSMPAFETEKIEEFKKHDLFMRYALDNLAGLMRQVDKNHPLWKRFIRNEDILEERILRVWENEKMPNFDKCVN